VTAEACTSWSPGAITPDQLLGEGRVYVPVPQIAELLPREHRPTGQTEIRIPQDFARRILKISLEIGNRLVKLNLAQDQSPLAALLKDAKSDKRKQAKAPNRSKPSGPKSSV
jgi:hypothetical protein